MKHIGTTVQVLAIFLVWSAAARAELPFDDRYLFAIQDGASSVAVADLNRDGHQDVVVASIESDMIRIRFGGAAPIYENLNSTFDRACFVLIADIDGDSWPDVIGGKRGTGDDQVRWWENPGETGSWIEHAVSGTWFDQARGLDTADLDQDGDTDIIIAGVEGSTGWVSWFENLDAVGTSWGLHDITTGFTGAHDAHVVDINRDGLPDVVAAAYDLDSIVWFENDGSIAGPGYWTSHLIGDGFDGAICVDSADIDQDGDPDVVAGAYQDDVVVWYQNNGGAWTQYAVATLDGVYDAQAVDVDQDGNIDVVAAGRVSGRVVWVEGFGGSWQTNVIDDSFAGARSATAADFDGDGDLDVVAAGEFDDHAAWWENLAVHRSAIFPDVETLTSGVDALDGLIIVDIDGDGSPDIVDHRRSGEAAPDIVIWSNTTGSWVSNPIVYDFDGPTEAVVVDVNTDGDLDIVAGARYSDEIAWFEGNGDGSYTMHEIVTAYDVNEVVAGDLDCDGDLDVVSTALDLNSVTIWWNDGEGASWTREDTGNHSLVKHVFLADLVGDAAPDLLVSAGVTSVYENQNCQGGGWDPSETLSMYMTNAVFGDLDGNGTTDIAAIDEPFDEMAVWLDLGTWTRFDVSTTIDAPFRIAKSDFDFDGDFDLVTTAYTDEELVWWENDGTGAGWTGHLIASIPHPAVLAVGDLDLDGVPEIVSGNWSADEIHIFENRGGQYRTSYQDVAPASVGESEVAVLLKAEFNIHGRSGDPDVELYRVLLEISDGSWNPLTIQQGEDLFDSFKVWHDENGNGVFDPGSDPEIASRPPVLSAEGRISVLVDSGSANPNIPGTGAGTFFVGVEMAFDAGAHDPGDFRVTAYSSPYSTIAYATHPHIRLRGEPWSAAQIGPVSIVDDGLFADGFESGDDSRWTSASP